MKTREPTQSLEPTTLAITLCASSSTARALGRGASITFGKMILDQTVYLKGPSTFFKTENDFMWIDVSRRYLVSTGLISVSRKTANAIPVHFIELDGGVIKVRLAKSKVWITHDCRKADDGLWWTIKEMEYFWQYILPEEVPDWAHEVFKKGAAQLDAYPA
jgi:hypothetical protein